MAIMQVMDSAYSAASQTYLVLVEVRRPNPMDSRAHLVSIPAEDLTSEERAKVAIEKAIVSQPTGIHDIRRMTWKSTLLE